MGPDRWTGRSLSSRERGSSVQYLLVLGVGAGRPQSLAVLRRPCWAPSWKAGSMQGAQDTAATRTAVISAGLTASEARERLCTPPASRSHVTAPVCAREGESPACRDEDRLREGPCAPSLPGARLLSLGLGGGPAWKRPSVRKAKRLGMAFVIPQKDPTVLVLGSRGQ